MVTSQILSSFVGMKEHQTGETLTMLSCGMGQESLIITFRLIHDSDFHERYAPGDLIIVFSNKGNEHPETYNYLPIMEKICDEHSCEDSEIE